MKQPWMQFGLSALLLAPLFALGLRAERTEAPLGEGKAKVAQHTYNFGVVYEGEQPQYTFTIENVGTGPLRILAVQPSCGCTAPQWTQEPIPPGGVGSVTLAFDSRGRPGPFRKSAIVITDGEPARLVLFIEGEVRFRPLDPERAVRTGPLLWSESQHDWGRTWRGSLLHHIFRVQNTGPRPVRFTGWRVLGLADTGAVRLEVPSVPLFQDDVAPIQVWFDTGRLIEEGPFRFLVRLRTDQPQIPEVELELRGFTFITGGQPEGSLYRPTEEDVRNGARIRFERERHHFGQVITGQSPVYVFRFRNEGRGLLRIRDLRSSCGCTAVVLNKTEFAPGEVGHLEVRLDTEGKLGFIQKTVSVFTNDPERYLSTLVVEAEIIEHPPVGGSAQPMRPMGAGMHGSIFEGTCRTCHADPAEGRLGRELYAAVCQMCHGPAGFDDGKPHPGPKLVVELLRQRTDAQLRAMIARGTPDERKRLMMPGFARSEGGPLSELQIRSLVAYLRSLERASTLQAMR
ncbi:MAG: DUF1573 domain-containing protein [Bacteroidota bacterium]|nr:DUF1573 domain-containing protein [Bacteroidota bacterium]MDW8137097.1 DUF1573 domain-containing protein [Bacteroidota bacterium]